MVCGLNSVTTHGLAILGLSFHIYKMGNTTLAKLLAAWHVILG